jgi:hypothetical protein
MKEITEELALLKPLVHNELLKDSSGNYKNYWQKKMPHGSNWYKNVTVNKLKSESNIVADNYKNINIEYVFDENGYRLFRPESFKNVKDEIFCFGCSFTLGFGLPEDHTWPYILGKKINMKPINYGVSAISTDFIARQVYQIFNTIPKEKYPKHVFIFFPDIFRKEYLINEGDKIYYNRFMISAPRGTAEESIKHFRPEYVDAYFKGNGIVSLFFNFVKDFHFIDSVLKSKKISWSWSAYSNFYRFPIKILETYLDTNTYIGKSGKVKILNYNNYEPARDGSHRGKKYMEDLAAIFAKTYTSCFFEKADQEKLDEENKLKFAPNTEFSEIDLKKNLENIAKELKDQDFIYE